MRNESDAYIRWIPYIREREREREREEKRREEKRREAIIEEENRIDFILMSLLLQ